MGNFVFKRLITTPSEQFLLNMISFAKKEIIIVSPWITQRMLLRVINAKNSKNTIKWKVLTRGNDEDFYQGLSDIEAFALMIRNESFKLRAIENLHAKVYVIDNKVSLVTSANLTDNGMRQNPELGVASQDPDEISQIVKEVKRWFREANQLDELWLKNEQAKILEYREKNPFFPPNYPSNKSKKSKEDNDVVVGKYRELPLPEDWKPLLDSLREIENSTKCNYFSLDSFYQIFEKFFKYINSLNNHQRIRVLLFEKYINNKFSEIEEYDEITRQRISQIIGKPGKTSGYVWRSEEGVEFRKQLSENLTKILNNEEIRVSDVLFTEQLKKLELSSLDLGKFLCGLMKNRIIDGNLFGEITPENHLLICHKEVHLKLQKMDNTIKTEKYQFLDLNNFCQLVNIEKNIDVWFTPDFHVFKNLYLTKNGKIGSRNWSIQNLIGAIAWELADLLNYYWWHYSQMYEAINYLYPTKYENTTVRNINSRISNSPEIFHFAGSKGYWQLTDLGDRYDSNKDAIINIFLETNRALDYKEITKELEMMGRRVNGGSIFALLEREDEFTYLGQGIFQLVARIR